MAAMFYSFEEAVRRLKTTRDELKAMVEQGKLREFRDGLDRLFRVDEVEAIAPKASETDVEETVLSESTEQTPSGDDVGAASEEEASDVDEVGLEALEPEEVVADVPSFDIRVELGMLDAEGTAAPEQPIAGESAEAVTFPEDSITEEPIESPPSVEPQPTIPTRRPAPMGYAHLSPPRKSAWQWFVGGLRNDRPVAVVLLFVGLGGILAACGAMAYLLYKLL
mgnify:CR=1 FL=1